MNTTNISNVTNITQHIIDMSIIPLRLDAGETILLISRIMSVLTSCLNSVIFSNRAILKKSQMFKYLLVMSIVDFGYSSLGFIWQLLGKFCNDISGRCGEIGQYVTIAYTIAFPIYWMSSMALFNIFMEIFLTFDRLFMILNKPSIVKKFNFPLLVSVLAIFCTLYYLPLCFLNYIVGKWSPSLNRVEYKMMPTLFGLSDAGKIVPTVLSTIRLVLIFCILFILNIVTILLFNAYQSKKKNLTNFSKNSSEGKANKKMAVMLICISLVYVFCNTPYMIFYSLSQINKSFSFLPFLNTFGLISIFLILPFKSVIFFSFNRLYRKQFIVLFNLIFCKKIQFERTLNSSLNTETSKIR
jgi:hypothetical protein